MLCTACPRCCGGERTDLLKNGFCRMPLLPVVARAALHFFEEPPISGSNGSGTVFFSGCPLTCVFCQNGRISRENFGKMVSVETLRGIFLQLIRQGAHNINLVSPTQFSWAIGEALREKLPVPVIYNTGGYDSPAALKSLDGKIDIYMPDMKYAFSEPARKYSGVADYPERAKAAIYEMYAQVGPYQLNDEGLLEKGLLLRHLVLPENLENTFAVIDWVARSFPKGSVLFSLMSQYTPVGAHSFSELARPLTKEEVEAAEQYLFQSGIEDGFVQELSAANETFIPAFDLTGVPL